MNQYSAVAGYNPHVGQLTAHTDPRRHRIIAKGRRGGGTTAAAFEIEVESQIWSGPPGCCDIGVFGPTESKTELIFSRVVNSFCKLRLLGQNAITRWRDAPGSRRIELAWGPRIVAFSLAQGLPAEGWGFRFVVVDEAQNLDWDIWSRSIRPALADHAGRALFVGTVGGSGFRRLHKLAEEHPLEWGIHPFPSVTNPAVNPAEIEQARAELPERIFNEQFMAVWQPDDAAVFDPRRFRLEPLTFREPDPDRLYVAGWDLARKVDETVGIVLDVTDEVWRPVWWWGGSREPWPTTCRRIEQIAEKYRCVRVTIDATGVGDVVAEHLDIPFGVLEPFVFTMPSKQRLLWNLQAQIEKGVCAIPVDATRLIRQLSEYAWDDEGLEKDWVMSFALAAWAGRAVRLMPVEIFSIG